MVIRDLNEVGCWKVHRGEEARTPFLPWVSFDVRHDDRLVRQWRRITSVLVWYFFGFGKCVSLNQLVHVPMNSVCFRYWSGIISYIVLLWLLKYTPRTYLVSHVFPYELKSLYHISFPVANKRRGCKGLGVWSLEFELQGGNKTRRVWRPFPHISSGGGLIRGGVCSILVLELNVCDFLRGVILGLPWMPVWRSGSGKVQLQCDRCH